MCDLDYMANNIGFQLDPAELNNEEVKDGEKSPSPRKGGLSIPLPGSDGSVKGDSRKSEPSPRAVTPQVPYLFHFLSPHATAFFNLQYTTAISTILLSRDIYKIHKYRLVKSVKFLEIISYSDLLLVILLYSRN